MRPVAEKRADAARGSEFAVLLRRVRDAGLLEPAVPQYITYTAVTVGLLLGCYALLIGLGDSWWTLGIAVALAALFAQFAFLGHDAGHKQIFASRKANHVYGALVGNLLIGVSIGWWTSNHNKHHAHPNTEDADPDIMGILAHSGARARMASGVKRLVVRHQGVLFFPMLTLEGLSLRISSWRGVLRWPIPNRGWEAALLASHALGYLLLVFLVLSPVKALVFIAVHQALFGLYMGTTFAPNHKGMAVLSADDTTGHLRKQVLTSRNVLGGRLLDTAFGGLNYQVEHHLFPSMPRPHLRRAQPMVAAYCAEIGLPYRATGFVASYREALGHLHTVGKEAGRAPSA
ncbi:fatty acid desaturase family protein [Nocardia sp. NPDC057227]|uniref:fatty acid desaturase family protein n=1 Tax=Nocardia sp. NPDC057227 TaxID=3346056 RepID=UPI00362E12B7